MMCIKSYKHIKRLLFKLSVAIFLVTIVSPAYGQKEAKIFTKYKKGKGNLPDFSYVGYHQGENEIPNITDYKLFDVTSFGAIPNDDISDKVSIQKAIKAANKNGSGIVFFPKGRFLVNEPQDSTNSIFSKCSRIIFRGSGSGIDGTELYMKNVLPPEDPKKMWSVPSLFVFGSDGTDKKIGLVTESVKVGNFRIKLNTSEGLKSGDWIMLKLLDNSKDLIASELKTCMVDPSWKDLIESGINIKVFYQIKKIDKTSLTLASPVSYNIDTKYKWEVYKYANNEEVGIEDIAFVGNYKEKFVHHGSWRDDSGFTILEFSRNSNSWIKNCRFTDCSVGALIKQSANITVLNCKITGNGGHEAITSIGSTNVLIAKCVDESSQWHSFGSSQGAMNTVIWKCIYPCTTSFESHSNQPRNTLLDEVEGGLLNSRAGGAITNMPNHMQGLVLWNYKQTNEPLKEFEFWPATNIWWKIPNPVIVGFRGGTTFNLNQLGQYESIGETVAPASLYIAQLKLRLKELPKWIKERQ